MAIKYLAGYSLGEQWRKHIETVPGRTRANLSSAVNKREHSQVVHVQHGRLSLYLCSTLRLWVTRAVGYTWHQPRRNYSFVSFSLVPKMVWSVFVPREDVWGSKAAVWIRNVSLPLEDWWCVSIANGCYRNRWLGHANFYENTVCSVQYSIQLFSQYSFGPENCSRRTKPLRQTMFWTGTAASTPLVTTSQKSRA